MKKSITNFLLKSSLILALAFATTSSFANVVTVTNTNDSGTGSLRKAIYVSNDNDTIRFNPNLINAGNTTITLASEIAFSKPLTIKGLYDATDTLFISGNNSSRIFSITKTTNVTLDSLVLINGNGEGPVNNNNGGAVLFKNSNTLFYSKLNL